MDFIYYQYSDVGFWIFMGIIIIHVLINLLIYVVTDHNGFGPDIEKYAIIPPKEKEIQKLRNIYTNHRNFESGGLDFNQLVLCIFTFWWFSSNLNDTKIVKQLKRAANYINILLFVCIGLFLYISFNPTKLHSNKYDQIAKDKLFFIYYFKPIPDSEKGVYGRNALYKRLSDGEEYSYAYNNTRKIYNIPLLPKNWFTRDTRIIVDKKWKAHKNYSKVQTWSLFDDSISFSRGHLKKIIEFDDNRTIKSETDFYKSSSALVSIRFDYIKKEQSYFINYPDSMRIDKSRFERLASE